MTAVGRPGQQRLGVRRHERVVGHVHDQGVQPAESGAASGLLNSTQQVGGSLGLSILVIVFGAASRNEVDQQIPTFLALANPAE